MLLEKGKSKGRIGVTVVFKFAEKAYSGNCVIILKVTSILNR